MAARRFPRPAVLRQQLLRDLATPLPDGLRVVEMAGLTRAHGVIVGDCVFVPPIGAQLAEQFARVVVGKARRAGLFPAEVA